MDRVACHLLVGLRFDGLLDFFALHLGLYLRLNGGLGILIDLSGCYGGVVAVHVQARGRKDHLGRDGLPHGSFHLRPDLRPDGGLHLGTQLLAHGSTHLRFDFRTHRLGDLGFHLGLHRRGDLLGDVIAFCLNGCGHGSEGFRVNRVGVQGGDQGVQNVCVVGDGQLRAVQARCGQLVPGSRQQSVEHLQGSGVQGRAVGIQRGKPVRKILRAACKAARAGRQGRGAVG